MAASASMRDSASPTDVCSDAQPLVERFELLLLQRQRLDLAADRVEQRGRRPSARRAVSRWTSWLSFVDASIRWLVSSDSFSMRPIVSSAFRRLLHALVQLADLHVHRPDHLVHAVGLDDGVLDGLLLAFERLGFVRDVLGERVERREPLFGALAQLVEPRQRSELVLDLLDRRHRRGRVFARFARGLADLGVVLRERRRRRADLIELALERAGLPQRLLDLGLAPRAAARGALRAPRAPSSACRASPASAAPATTDAAPLRDASAARRPARSPSASSARPAARTPSAPGCACRSLPAPSCDRRARSGAWRSRRAAS